MTSYQLRIDDTDLWAAVTRRAASEGRSKRHILIALAREYVAHGLRPAEEMPVSDTAITLASLAVRTGRESMPVDNSARALGYMCARCGHTIEPDCDCPCNTNIE